MNPPCCLDSYVCCFLISFFLSFFLRVPHTLIFCQSSSSSPCKICQTQKNGFLTFYAAPRNGKTPIGNICNFLLPLHITIIFSKNQTKATSFFPHFSTKLTIISFRNVSKNVLLSFGQAMKSCPQPLSDSPRRCDGYRPRHRVSSYYNHHVSSE